jgi:FG-GAP-like repeat
VSAQHPAPHHVARFPLACSFLALAAAVAGGGGMANAAGLTYVESSAGLAVPALERGRTEIEMSDVDGDGALDLVSIGDHGSPFINTSEHGLMVWFGDGNGAFSVVQTGDFGYGGVALGDVNGDGLMDAAYGMHHDYADGDLGDQIMEVALGDGSGTVWTPWDDGLATNGETYGMFGTDLADVDGDGDLDVASNSFGCCAGVHVYMNQGDGTWVQSFGFLGGNSTQDLAFADVNGDGSPDLVVAHQQQTVYLGDGAGGFAPADGNLPAGGLVGRRGPSAGDVDGDGDEDLAFVNGQGGVSVWRWNGPGSWIVASGGLPASGSYESTQLFDMDLDGAVDLLGFGNGTLTLWRGDGNGLWTPAGGLQTPTPGYLAAFRAGGDLDANGFPDLALIDEEGSGLARRNRVHAYLESTAAAEVAVRAVRPRPAATLRAGAAAFIDWTSALPAGAGGAAIDLELSTSGAGGPWVPITSGIVNSGRFQWRVPHGAASQCRIRYTLTTSAGSATAITAGDFTIVDPLAAVALAPAVPAAGTRITAFPNPFARETRLGLPGAGAGGGVLSIYDPIGRLIRSFQVTGPAVRWDGRDARGARVGSGAYFLRYDAAAGGGTAGPAKAATGTVIRSR